MPHHHPWRELRRRADLIVKWVLMPPGYVGATDGSVIWMDPRQGQAQRRSTLTHELEHIRRGHTGCVGDAEERSVCEAAARTLIPIEALADALLWSSIEGDLADELWVDVQTVRDRLATLTQAEVAAIEDRVAMLEEGA